MSSSTVKPIPERRRLRRSAPAPRGARGAGAALAALAALAASACDEAMTTSDAQDTAVDCAAESRDDTWAPGLEKTGSEGLVTVRFVDATPAPPARFENRWTLEVRNQDDAPQDDLPIDVTPFMPDHAHGTSSVPTVEGLGSGRYRIEKIDLWMPGLWEIRLAVGEGVEVDRLVFRFCIAE